MTTFDTFLQTPVEPDNLEHRQARARHMHDAIWAVIADDPILRDSFPPIGEAHKLTCEQLADWWHCFRIWFDSLPMEDWVLVNQASFSTL